MKKKLIILSILCFSLQGRLQAMEESPQGFSLKSADTIEANICIVKSDPIYAANGYFFHSTQLRKISDVLGDKIDSNEPLQEVWISKGSLQMSLYLPFCKIETLKEDQKLDIKIERQPYQLNVNQRDSRHSDLGNFQSAVARYKKMFIQNPAYYADCEEQLIAKSILAKNAFGITHGPKGWPQAQTLSTKAKRNAGKLSLLGLSTLAVGYAWWKGYFQTPSIFSTVGLWASRLFPAKS